MYNHEQNILRQICPPPSMFVLITFWYFHHQYLRGRDKVFDLDILFVSHKFVHGCLKFLVHFLTFLSTRIFCCLVFLFFFMLGWNYYLQKNSSYELSSAAIWQHHRIDEQDGQNDDEISDSMIKHWFTSLYQISVLNYMKHEVHNMFPHVTIFNSGF